MIFSKIIKQRHTAKRGRLGIIEKDISTTALIQRNCKWRHRLGSGIIITIIYASALAWMPLNSKADFININFGVDAYNGSGVTAGGTVWNFAGGTEASALSLVNSYGGSTSLSLDYNASSKFTGDSEIGDSPEKLLGSGLYGPFSFSISSTDNTLQYTVYTFHYDKAGHNTTTTLTGSSSYTATPTSTTTKSSFIEGGNYLVFPPMSPKPNGTISGSSEVAWGGLNGIQISTIPEPRTAFLIILAFTTIVASIRKRACAGN